MEDKGPPSGDFWNLILSEGGGTVDDYYPPDSAVHAHEKAEGFKEAGRHVRQAVTRTNDIATRLHGTAWRDRGGASMRDLVQNNNNDINQTADGLASIGGTYESYANLLVDIKDKIHDTYDRNHLIYVALGFNPPWVIGYYRRKLAEGVAKDIKDMIRQTAHDMLNPPAEVDPTPHDGFFGGLWDSAVVQVKAFAGLAGWGEGGFSLYTAEQAWGNLGLLVGGAVLYGLDPDLGRFVDDKLFKGVLGDTLTEFGENFVDRDAWGKDWRHVLGYTAGNVVGFLGTRGVGAGIARAARGVGKGVKAADLTGFRKGLHKVGDVVSKANLTGAAKFGLGKTTHVVDALRNSHRAEDAAAGAGRGKETSPPPGPVEPAPKGEGHQPPKGDGPEPPKQGPPRDGDPPPPKPRDGEPSLPAPREKELLQRGVEKNFLDAHQRSGGDSVPSPRDLVHPSEAKPAPSHGGTPAEHHGAAPHRHGGPDPVHQADRPVAAEPSAAESKAPQESPRGADASLSRDGLDGQGGHAQPSADSPPHGLRDQLGPGQSGLFDKAWEESAHSGYSPRVREEFAFWRATGHVSPNIGHGLRMEIIDSIRKADVDPPPPTLSRDSVTKEDVAGGAIGRDAANMARNDLKNLGREGSAPAKALDGLRDRGTGQPGEVRAGKHGEEAPADRRNPASEEAGHGSKDGSRGDRDGADGGPADRVKAEEPALRERRERFETPIDQFAKKHMPDEYAKRHGDDGPTDGVGPGGGGPKKPGPEPRGGSGAEAAPRSPTVGLLESAAPSVAHDVAPARGAADRSGSTTVSPKPLPHASVTGLRESTTGLADPAKIGDRVAKPEDAAGPARPEPEGLKVWREERSPEGESARLPAEPPGSPPPRPPARITPEPAAPARQPGRVADGPAAGPLSRAADEMTATRDAGRTRPPAAFPSVRQPEIVPRPPDEFPATRPAEFTEPKHLDYRPSRPLDPMPTPGLPTAPATHVPPGDFPGPAPAKPPAPELPLHRPPQPEKPTPIELPARPEHDSSALPRTPARPGDPVAPGVSRPPVPGWPEEFPLRIDRPAPLAPEIPAWPGKDDGFTDPDTDPLAEIPPEVLEHLNDTEREALRNLAAGLGWNAARVLHRVLDEIIDRLILHPRPGEPRRTISRAADLAGKLKFLEEHEEREWLGERLGELTGTRPEKPRRVRPERGGGGILEPQSMPISLGPWGFADATVREHQEIDALLRFAAYLADPVKNPLSDRERAAIREILAYRAQRVRGEDPALDALYELFLENPDWLAGAEIEGGPLPVLDERGEPTGMVEVAGRLAGPTGLRILIVPARDLREGSAARGEAVDRARTWLDAAPEGVRNSVVLDGRQPAGKDPETASLSRDLLDLGFDAVFQHREFHGREAKAAPYTVLASLSHPKSSFAEKATADRPVRSPALAEALGEEAAVRARQFVERHWPERALEGDLRRLDTGQLTDALLVGAEIVHVVPAGRDAHGRPTGFPWVVVRLADSSLARVTMADAAQPDLPRRAREDLANRPFGKRDFLVIDGAAAWHDQPGPREIARQLTEGPGRRFDGVLYRQNWEGPRTPGKDSPFTLLTPNPRLKGKLLAAVPREPRAPEPENKPPEPRESTEAERLTGFRALADVMAGMYERLAAEAGPSVAPDDVFAVFKENNPELFGYLREAGTAAAVDASRLADLLGDGVERRAWSPEAREGHLDNVALGIARGWDLTDAERALLAAMDVYAPELPAFRREFGDLLDRVRQTMPEELEPLLGSLGGEVYSIDEKMLLAKKYFAVFLDAGNKPGPHAPDELPRQLEEAAPKVSALLEEEAALGTLSHEEVQRRTMSWAGFVAKAADLRDSIAEAERTRDVRPVLETLRALGDSLRAYAREHADSPVPGWVEVAGFDLLDPHRMRFLQPSVTGNGRFDVVTRAITRHWLEALFGAEGVAFAHRLTESAVPWDGRSIASHPMRDEILAAIGEDKLFGRPKRRAVALPGLGLCLVRPEVGLGELVSTLVHECVVHGMQEPKPVDSYRGLDGEWFETLMRVSHEFQGRSGELLVVEALRAAAGDSVVPRELRVDVVPRSLRVPTAEWDSSWMSRVIGNGAGRLGEAGRAALSGQQREIGFGHESDAGRIRRAVVDPRHPPIETPAVQEFKADPAAFAAKYPAPPPALRPAMPPPAPRPSAGPGDLIWPDPMIGGPRPFDTGVPWQPGKRPRHPQRQAPHPRRGGVPTPPGLPAALAGFWAALRAEDRRALADLAAEVGPRAGFPVLKNFTTLLARKNGFPEKTGEALAHWLAQVAPPAGLPPEWAPVWHALPATAQHAFSELITAVGAAAATGELIDRVSDLTTHQGGILEQIADLRGHPERFGVLARQLTAAIASLPSAAPAVLLPAPGPAPAPAGPVPIEAGEPVAGKTYPEKVQQALWQAFPEAVKAAGMTIVGGDARSSTVADPRGRTIGVVLGLADLEGAAGQWSARRRHPDHGPALGVIEISASTRMPLDVALRVAVHGLIAGYAKLTGDPAADPGARFLSPEGNLDGLPRPTAADRGYLAQLFVLGRAFDGAKWNLPRRYRLRKEIRDVIGKLGLDPNQANQGHRLAALGREPVTSLIARHLPPKVTGGYPVTRTHVATGLITGFLPSGGAAVVFAASGSPASGVAWGVFGLVNAVYGGFLAREWEIKKDAQVAEVRKYDAKAREIDAVAAPAQRVRSLLEVLGWAPEEGHEVPADKQAMGPRPDLAQPLRKHGARFSVPQLTALGAGTMASVPFEIWADKGIGLASWLSLAVYSVGAAVFLPLAERARTRVQKGAELKEIDNRARGLDKAEADVYAAMGQRLGLERPPEPSEIPDPHNAHLSMPELGIMANLPDFAQYFSEILRRGLRPTAAGTIDNTAMLAQHLTLFQALGAYGAGKSLLMLPIAVWQLNKLDQLELGYTVDRKSFDERDIRRLMRPDVYAERRAMLEQVEKMIAPPRPGLVRRFREALPFLGHPRPEPVRSVVPDAPAIETRPRFAPWAEFMKTYTRVSVIGSGVTVGFVEAFGVTESLAVAALTAGLFGPVIGLRKWWHRRHELELSDKDIAETNQVKAAERVAVQMATSAFVDSQVILSAATVMAELERPGRSAARQAVPVRTAVPGFTAIRIDPHEYPGGNWADAYRDALRDLRRSLGAEATRLDSNQSRRDWGDYRTLGERRLAIAELVALAERAATYLDDHHRTGNGLPVWEANADLSNAIDRYHWLSSPEWPKEPDPAPDAPRRPGDDPEVKQAEEAAVRHLRYRDPPVRRNSIDHRGGWQGLPARASGRTHRLPAIHDGSPGWGAPDIARYTQERFPELRLTNPNYHAPDAYLDGYRTNCTRDVVYYVRRLRGEDVTAPPLRPADSAVLGTLEYVSDRLGGTWDHSHGTSYDSVISAMLDRPSGAMAVLAMEYRLADGRLKRHVALVVNDEGRIVFLDPQDGWLLSLPKDPAGLELLPFTDVGSPRGDLHLPEPRVAAISPVGNGYHGKDDDVSLGSAEVEAVHAREAGHAAHRETGNPASSVPREDSALFRTTRRNALPAMHAKTVAGRGEAAASYLLSQHPRLLEANPRYHSPDALDDGYLTNSTRAVVYYVRRLRGEDVTAPPAPPGRVQEMAGLGYISDRLGGTWDHGHGTSYDSVVAAMTDRPVGALAVVHVTSTQRGGSVRDQVALVSRDECGVVFLDPHNGRPARLPKRVTGIGLLTFTDAELPPRGHAGILTEAAAEVARRGAGEILGESVLAPRPGPIEPTGTQWAAVRAVREGIVSSPDSPPVPSGPASREDQDLLDDLAEWLAKAAGGTAGHREDTSAFVVFDKVSWAYQALDVVRERLGTGPVGIVSLDDRFFRPRHDGYRDLRLTLRLPSGHLAELQLRLKAIEDVAETARVLDETVGTLIGRGEERTRTLSRAEEALEVTISRRRAELFDEATKRGLPSPPPPGPEAFGDAAEAAMTAAEPLGCVEFGDGRRSANATYHLTYADHPRTIYKPASGESRALGSHLPLAGQGYREVAMYRLARAVGSEAVPPTAYLDGPLGPGSGQVWREDAGPALEVTAYPREQQQLIAFLDYVAASLDRSPNDCLTGPAGEAIVIDNGQSFPDYADPLAGIRSGFVAAWFDVPFDAEVLAAIRAVDPAWLVRMLVATGIGDEAAEGARERLEELQRLGRIAGQTWTARIWDHEWKLVREFK